MVFFFFWVSAEYLLVICIYYKINEKLWTFIFNWIGHAPNVQRSCWLTVTVDSDFVTAQGTVWYQPIGTSHGSERFQKSERRLSIPGSMHSKPPSRGWWCLSYLVKADILPATRWRNTSIGITGKNETRQSRRLKRTLPVWSVISSDYSSYGRRMVGLRHHPWKPIIVVST